jgi:hypothetical protein
VHSLVSRPPWTIPKFLANVMGVESESERRRHYGPGRIRLEPRGGPGWGFVRVSHSESVGMMPIFIVRPPRRQTHLPHVTLSTICHHVGVEW